MVPRASASAEACEAHEWQVGRSRVHDRLNKQKKWQDLTDLDGGLSSDLMACFLFDSAGLTDEQQRAIVIACGSKV